MSYLEPPPMPAPIVVVKDVGGLVRDYQDRTELYRSQNREVRLHECRSACTLALSLPNVCVYPTSQLKFHQAYNQNTREVDHGVTSELWTSYPQAVRERLGFLTRSYKVIQGSELIAMGFRNCNAPAPQPAIMIAKARRQEAPAASSGFLSGVQTAVAALFPGQSQSGPQMAARAPEPIRRAAPLDAPPAIAPPETVVEAPLPPPRPPLIGVAVPAPPPAAPAYLRPIPGSTPILEARFIGLRAAMRRLAGL